MTGPEFTVGGVIRRTFALLGRHFGDLSVAAALLVFLPNFAAFAASASTARTVDAAGRLRDSSSHVSLLGSGGSLVGWATSLVLYGIVVQAALVDLRGERFGLEAAFAASLKAFLPNLGIWILYYLAIILGFVVLVVPGLMLQCAWLVVVPASMVEGTGVLGAFGRSRALTAGHRWRIFGLLLLYGLGFSVVGLVVLIGAVMTVGVVGTAGSWTFAILSAILMAAISLVGSAGATACYIALRAAKGEAPSSDFVSAFE